MSLTLGTGPLGTKPAGDFNFSLDHAPAHRLYFEPYPRRVRAMIGEHVVLDSVRGRLLYESNIGPRLYVPLEDFDASLLEPSDHTTHCPFKGDASHWHVRANDRIIENAAWSYDEPYGDAAPIREYISFYPERVSAIYAGDAAVPSVAAASTSPQSASIGDWLLARAWQETAPDRLVDAFCRCLRAHGVPVSRMTVIVPTLHPQVAASVFVWNEESGVK